MKKVMVFGVFDGLHDGHRKLLQQAKERGDFLIVVAAQDHVVQKLKGHAPRIGLDERCARLELENEVDQVLPGDETLGTWDIVKIHQPDVIALGYDQQAVKADLEAHLKSFNPRPEIVILEAHRPDELHSSILNEKDLPTSDVARKF